MTPDKSSSWCDNKAIEKGKKLAMPTKFSEKFPISMLKKDRIINGPTWNIMVQLIFNNFCFRPSKTNKDKKGVI